MLLHFPTLFAVTIFVSAVAGLLLLFAWMQNRSILALGLWGVAFLMSTAAMSLLPAYGEAPGFWTATYAPALWVAGHGIMWSAARDFEGRRTPVYLTLAGAAVWLIACQFEGFYGWLQARIMLASGISASYLLLCASEIWRGQDRELLSRWPATVLLVLHAGVLLARVAFSGMLPYPAGIGPPSPGWLPLGIFEFLFHSFCMSVLLVNMAKERAELQQRQASLIDPLTGVANRRAFVERGDVLLRQAKSEGHAAALLLFDLDRFKQVNDTLGHQAGDRVLSIFCDVAGSALKGEGLFGRFGGEEFACLLVDVSLTQALRMAERVRAAFASAPLDIGAPTPALTVSVGVATSSAREETLEQLFAAADRALYGAKAKGRNRVEAARAPLVLLDSSSAAAG